MKATPRKAGYTLLELMAVMLIVALMMGMAFAGYYSATQGAAMRSAVSTVRNGIASARGLAISRSRVVNVVITSNGVFSHYMSGGFTTRVEQTDGNYLPPHIFLHHEEDGSSPMGDKVFRVFPDGSAGVSANMTFEVRERGRQAYFEITLNGLTGSVRAEAKP